MTPILRTVEWARQQLGHAQTSTTHQWLRRNGVKVVSGRFREDHFWAVWDQSGPVDLGSVREALR